MNNNENNWNHENHHLEKKPHPLVKIYLKLVALLGCVYLVYNSWCFFSSDVMVSYRCRMFKLEQDRCDGLEGPRLSEICSLGMHLGLYTLLPLVSMVAQLHHLLIWLKPSLWQRMPKNMFFTLHRPCYFPLYHATFVSIAAAVSNMLAVNTVNPVDRLYSERNFYFYITSSLTALWCFFLLFQFPMYSRMTVLDEHLLTRRANMRLDEEN